MMDFCEIEIGQKEQIEAIRRRFSHSLSSHAFSSLLLWAKEYSLTIALQSDWFVVKGRQGVFFPCGNTQKTIDFLKELRTPERLCYLRRQDAELACHTLPGAKVFADAGTSEYLYSVAEQAALGGGKFGRIRKKVNTFTQGRAVDVRTMLAADSQTVTELAQRWANEKTGTDGSHFGDVFAVQKAMEHFDALGLEGLLVSVGGAPCGYAFGCGIGGRTFDLHSMKSTEGSGDADFFMLQQLCRRILPRYDILNREEDLGIEGLRQRKRVAKPIGQNELFYAVL